MNRSNHLELASGLIWYAECKNFALNKVENFVAPVNSYDLRMYHSLYLVNLHALLDRSIEIFGQYLNDKWVLYLQEGSKFSGDNNAGYLRELRNAVIHRGLDLTAQGEAIDGRIFVHAPEMVGDRLGKKEPFIAFSKYLKDVFRLCEIAIKQVLRPEIEVIIAEIEEKPISQMKADYLRNLEASTFEPEWAKAMSRKAVDELPFDRWRSHNADQYRKLFGVDGIPPVEKPDFDYL